jgi:hypothetical protein
MTLGLIVQAQGDRYGDKQGWRQGRCRLRRQRAEKPAGQARFRCDGPEPAASNRQQGWPGGPPEGHGARIRFGKAGKWSAVTAPTWPTSVARAGKAGNRPTAPPLLRRRATARVRKTNDDPGIARLLTLLPCRAPVTIACKRSRAAVPGAVLRRIDVQTACIQHAIPSSHILSRISNIHSAPSLTRITLTTASPELFPPNS